MHENQRIGKFIPLMRSLYGAARENLGFKPHAKICIVKSGNNMENPLGKTAYYSPSNHKIGLYTQGRHIKDILRSLAHELVHHDQNCRGDFEQNGETVAGYAQEDGHLREMEREAYERGNMIFRDWEDNLKDKGGKPLFTSISQYVPSPSNDVVGMPLFEQKKMKKRLNEQAGLEAAIKKQIGDDAEDAIASLHKIQAKKPKCGTYIAQLNAWARDRELKLQALSNWLPITKEKCEQERGGGAMAQDKGLTFRSSKALDAFGQLTGVSQNWRQHVAEDQKQKTNNSLVEGDKMNKKLKESQLRTIVRGLIRETVLGMNVGSEAERRAAETGQPWQIGETAEGEFDETNPDDVAYKKGPVFEDSGEEEEEHYDRNVDSDEDHIDAIRHHLDALEHDKDYDKEHEEDHDEDHEDLEESFLPKGRSIRQKARTELNETLMKRWTKIIK